MVRSIMLVLMAALTLLSAPEVRAGRRHDGLRCRKDAQCLSGTCCNGRCNPQSASCNELADLAALVTGGPGGELDAAPKPTGQGKPPAPEKCRNGFHCGTCGVCKKGRCVGGETGQCGSCMICSQDGSACIGVPDGSGSGPDGYHGCGPDALGGLACCSGDCVDTRGNSYHCGACGNACTGGTTCQEITIGGAFECACPDSKTECDGTCVDTKTDPNNCGACGHVCPNSGSCQDGECNPCPNWTGLDYTWCPADLGGDTIGVCCRPETPQCCFASHGGSCCGANETCCDGYCCGAGTHCCPNSRHTYACIPDGQQCPE
jgi:hypothetical protein